jgi:mannose-1-phosphate guanylyltransferase
MLCALIMAGGKGTRFWPLSTEDKPKQFLKLLGEDTMLQTTIKRINKLIPLERIFICTGETYVSLIKEQLPDLNDKNIIIEPEGKNTAPCITLSAFYIKRLYKDSTMVVLPSDHLIKDEEIFIDIINSSYKYLDNNEDAIITLGIKPENPETGYGYIKFSNRVEKINNYLINDVDTFVEKPNSEIAIKYLNSGNYLWNGGMFVCRTNTILNNLKKYVPSIYELLSKTESLEGEALNEYIKNNYSKCESISIDYAVMERSKSIKVITCDFGWDDVGSWSALDRYRDKDIQHNVIHGDAKIIDSRNNIVLSNGKKIVFYGVENLLCVETDDMTIVTNKNHMNNLRNIKELIG